MDHGSTNRAAGKRKRRCHGRLPRGRHLISDLPFGLVKAPAISEKWDPPTIAASVLAENEREFLAK
jgi:hypothetical protein